MSLMPSWIEAANAPDVPFPVNNLPYGVFSTDNLAPRCGVAIGDAVFDVGTAVEAGLIKLPAALFAEPSWNAVMAAGPSVWQYLRDRLQCLFAADSVRDLAESDSLQSRLLHPLDLVHLHMPFAVSEFTDFYAGRHHATNVGTMFRGAENALPPNWLHMPIGYNGRASSVVVSGTPVRRPLGQRKPTGEDLPVFTPSRRLDFELELGAVVGTGNALGQPVNAADADAMIFGYVLLNDWSARDIQAWEYQPLGPFQAKAFATSISPWIVPRAALDPFRVPAPARDHELLAYLRDEGKAFYDISVSASLTPDAETAATKVTQTNTRELYYSAAQQLAHHTVSGCPMRPGDLLGSGTISGPTTESRGCLLERCWGGEQPLPLVTGGERCFLEDGDSITLRGAAIGDGYTVGFGECEGTVLPALPAGGSA